MFSSSLTMALNDGVALVSRSVLFAGIPVVDGDVLTVSELLVLEEDVGSADCEDDDSGGANDDVPPGSLLTGLQVRTETKRTFWLVLCPSSLFLSSCLSWFLSSSCCSTLINSFHVLTDDIVEFLTKVPPGRS